MAVWEGRRCGAVGAVVTAVLGATAVPEATAVPGATAVLGATASTTRATRAVGTGAAEPGDRGVHPPPPSLLLIEEKTGNWKQLSSLAALSVSNQNDAGLSNGTQCQELYMRYKTVLS